MCSPDPPPILARFGKDHEKVNFAGEKKTDQVFDQAFDEIRRRGSTDLIIDIRGNGGGDSRMGDYVLSFVRPKQPARKTYMLTDHLVFSSAVMFADAFRDYNVGTIVGYETGGTPSHYGYPRTFELKNSGIDSGVSRTPFQRAQAQPGRRPTWRAARCRGESRVAGSLHDRSRPGAGIHPGAHPQESREPAVNPRPGD